jgi:hypothetical protein
VRGLQALARAHGGTLSTNPDTGLPEAGFLRKLLPTLIGAGLAMTGVGAPMAALLVGGGYGAATGDLRKGLLAGLGAYGGAGLSSSIMGAGASSLGAANAVSPTVGAGAVVPEAATAAIPEATGAVVGGPMSSVVPQATAIPPMEYAAFNPAPTEFGAFGEAPVSTIAATPPAPVTPQPNLGEFANAKDQLLQRQLVESPAYAPEVTAGQKMKAGLSAIADKPDLLFNKDNMYTLGAAALPMLLGGGSGAGYKGSGPNPYEYTYDYQSGQYKRVPVGTRDQFEMTPNVPMQRAAGGPVQEMSDRNEQEMFVANGGETYSDGGFAGMFKKIREHIENANRNPYEYTYGADGKFTEVPVGTRQAMYANQARPMAKGGLSHLGDYSDGGRLLRGPGDGVSDSIPAVIGEKRPARLADGEFVVPARVVSELGNGSTEAGARKLYAMMDRVQKARGKTVGKGKVAANTRSDKYLPA